MNSYQYRGTDLSKVGEGERRPRRAQAVWEPKQVRVWWVARDRARQAWHPWLSQCKGLQEQHTWDLSITCPTNNYLSYESFCYKFIFVEWKREEGGGVTLEEL